MTQLSFALERHGPIEGQPEWTCEPVDRSGMARYVHLIRAKGDPERTAARGAESEDKTPHLTLRKRGDFREAIRAHLADGVARTFNRIAVELVDHTADVAFDSPLDHALWALVEAGEVEHTLVVPILFRARTP